MGDRSPIEGIATDCVAIQSGSHLAGALTMKRPATAFLAATLVWACLPATALAACTVPQTITNGQVADATQVMSNFNAVASCVDTLDSQAVTKSGTPTTGGVAVFSGPKSVTSGTLTGDVTTGAGNTVATLAPSGVTPGTYTNPTVTIDAKGRVISAANGTGGGSGGVNYFNSYNLPVPVVGNFSVSADPSFGTNFGLQSAASGVSLYGGNTGFNFAWADQTIAGGGTTGDFAVTGLIKLGFLDLNDYAMGITLGDGTKRITWGYRNSQLWMSRTSGTGVSDGYWTFGGNVGAISAPTLFRIRRTGATMYFEIALDGKNFDVIFSEPANAYLGANVTRYGLGLLPNNTYQRLICYGLLGQ